MGVLCPNNRRKEKVGMGKSKVNKVVAMILVFMMMFSNLGYTISAIATSDGFEVITNGFFEKEEVKFEAYFEEDGKKTEELISDVNKTVKLKMKLEPNVEGYLKEANVKFVDENGESPNFKIKDIKTASIGLVNEPMTDMLSNLGTKEEVPEEKTEENVVEENATEESAENEVKEDIVEESAMSNSVEEEKVENTVENTTSEENVVDNTVVENTTSEDTNTIVEENKESNTVSEENVVDGNVVEENKVEEPKVEEQEEVKEDEKIEEEIKEEPVEEEVQPEAPVPQEEEDVLIDEEKVIEEKTEEAEEEQIDFASDVKVVAENEVKIINVIEETEYIVEIEFVQGEELEIADLCKEISMQLTGTFINSDLEEVDVAKEEKVTVGWKYSKDIEITSEYTKVSPFKIGESQGTIVENKITVKRNVEEEKYLPVKETRLNVTIPTFNNKAPIEVNVIASKLLATRGEDIGEVEFGIENWKYDKESGKIEIIVTNEKEGKAVNSFGEDEYTIIYRFEDYTEDITSKLGRNVVVRVEEYNAKENNVIEKEIKDNQEIGVNVGELVTYSIDTSEEKVEKSRVYANYNSEEALYETEYRSNVTVNILTSDMLEKLKIEASKEFYKDINGNSFKAEGIKYKNIKFNYSDVKNILQKGGNIEVYTTAGELVYTLDNSLIKTEEDCIININYADGIVVYVNNIAVNGTIHFEMTKVIKKCNYDKAAFKNFTEIESRITAEVKYSNIDQTLALDEIKVAKGLKESYTRANVYINKENLSTIQPNENVELKIELNNDKEDSDLYVNPSFEFVFPKYVKEVNVESINLLYENGLRVSDFETYVESDIVKMRVELTGVQTTFSESSITNGTNILINVKIRVDEYTPSKEDQIKLYYCNEGVTNYESQTKWTISKQIPNGILKTTNGFDVAVFKYQAPNGMVAINGIRNYDGNLSEIKSVRQGDTTEEIPMNDVSRIATMDLLTLNNTGNECTDVVLIGRIPFKGNKDVITGKDLGTTTTGVMKDFIKEDIQNFNMSTIYYSTNEKASKSLEDGANGWRLAEYVENINEVKSYMIVVKGSVAPGTVLKYNYDFEIPENLPYEVSMVGSFGAYYNNNTDVAVVYESTIADKVGVTTEAGPRVEATLSVNIGNNNIGENKYLDYTLIVKNTGSMVAENIIVTNPIPKYTNLCELSNDFGGMSYDIKMDTEKVWKIDRLDIGEEKAFTYVLKTDMIPNIKAYFVGENIEEDESGYYIVDIETGEKKYVSVPDIYIENMATVKVDNLAIEKTSNIVRNRLVNSKVDIQLIGMIKNRLEIGEEIEYRFSVTNISEEDLKDVILQFIIPKELKFLRLERYLPLHEELKGIEDVFNEETNTMDLKIDDFYKDETITFNLKCVIIEARDNVQAHLSFFDSEGTEEKSRDVVLSFKGGKLEVLHTTNIVGNKVKEKENVEFAILLKNTGNAQLRNIKIDSEMSQNLDGTQINYSGSSSGSIAIQDGKITNTFPTIPGGEEILVKIEGTAAMLNGEAQKIISNQAEIEAEYVEKIQTDLIELIIEKNPELEKKEEEEQSKEENKEPEAQEPTENEKPSSNGNTTNPPTVDNSNDSGKKEEKPNTQKPVVQEPEEIIEEEPEEEKFVIDGMVWLDENKDGIKDEKEKRIAAVKVQLLKAGTMIKATTTDGEGKYRFVDLEKGNYSVIFMYDGETYSATTYQRSGVSADKDSNAYQAEEGKALTNDVVITTNNMTNIDLGLQTKDTFDLSINKYLVASTVRSGSKEEKQEYDNSKIAKIEIHSKKLQGSEVDVEYKFVIKNEGNISGKAVQIVDYLPEGMVFDQNKNAGWYLGNDGLLYNDTLKETNIMQGQSKELRLVLTKQMTANNTGVVSNKVAIVSTENDLAEKDNTDNNTSTQEIIITIKTGGALDVIKVITTTITLCVIILYVLHKGKDFNKNKVFVNKQEIKNDKTKKFYK